MGVLRLLGSPADQPDAPLQPVNPDRNAYEDDDRANKKPKVRDKPGSDRMHL